MPGGDSLKEIFPEVCAVRSGTGAGGAGMARGGGGGMGRVGIRVPHLEHPFAGVRWDQVV